MILSIPFFSSASYCESAADLLSWPVVLPNFIFLICYSWTSKIALHCITILFCGLQKIHLCTLSISLGYIFSFSTMMSPFVGIKHPADEQVFFPEISSMFLYIVCSVLPQYISMFLHFTFIHFSLASSQFLLISLCKVLYFSVLFFTGLLFFFQKYTRSFIFIRNSRAIKN